MRYIENINDEITTITMIVDIMMNEVLQDTSTVLKHQRGTEMRD
jgi:hypothetical protein